MELSSVEISQHCQAWDCSMFFAASNEYLPQLAAPGGARHCVSRHLWETTQQEPAFSLASAPVILMGKLKVLMDAVSLSIIFEMAGYTYNVFINLYVN